jgi:hypothetical protein
MDGWENAAGRRDWRSMMVTREGIFGHERRAFMLEDGTGYGQAGKGLARAFLLHSLFS